MIGFDFYFILLYCLSDYDKKGGELRSGKDNKYGLKYIIELAIELPYKFM